MFELGDDFSKLAKMVEKQRVIPEWDKNKVSDLSISEFENIIRKIVMEELSKVNFTQIQQIQPLPYPQRQPYPWEGPWVNSEGYVTCNSLKQPHPMPEDVTVTSINLKGDINV